MSGKYNPDLFFRLNFRASSKASLALQALNWRETPLRVVAKSFDKFKNSYPD
jgi:hypothetical protein